MPACSIVVRSYNEEKHIGRLLTGILEQTVTDVEVILVDSGSTDATVAIASRFPVRILTIEPEQFTFGRSLNIGCAEARSEFIVLASAHVYPIYVDWLERLLEPFQDPQIALAYGKQRGNEITRFSEQQLFLKLYPDQSKPRQDHPLCNNANAAIRKAAWSRHAYDEKLPGLEDVAWAQWALSEDYRLAYIAEAEVAHVHEETTGQVLNRYRREAMALKQIRPQERFGLLDFARFYGANVINDLIQAGRERKLRKTWPDILLFRFGQFWGTYRGFSYPGELTSELRRAFYYPTSASDGSADSPRGEEMIHYEAPHSLP
jgi:glycosyltransferase involved in cell wall biosynthesis